MKKIGEFLKKHKRHVLLYCIIGLLLLSAVGVGVYLIRGVASNGDKVAGKLYWNVDGKEHLDPEMGLSKRPADKDGAYRVTFAINGEHVTYEIENKKLLHQVDNKTLMGLEFNEEGVVVGVLDPKDVVADEIAPSYYVMSMEKDKIVTNGMQSGEGIEVEVPLTENTNIWNMKSTAEFVGEKGTPVKDDIVRAFLNEKGEVTDVFIVGVYNPFGSEAIPGYCEHCQQTVGWYEWSNRHTLPTVTAHWRLVYDVECNKRQVQIGEDQHLVLDLNGKTIKNTVNYRTYCTFNAGGSLSILDSSTDQSGRIVARGESNQSGMAVWVRYGTFNLYSGTLDASESVITGYGTTVSLDVNTTFNMYGGTIIGGTTKTAAREDGKGYIGGFGGAVSVANGATFNMYGGTIKDGNAVWLKKADGIIIGGGGGNVYIRGGGTMNMEGGEILDGRAQQMAGNVLLGAADAVFTMKNDSVISGGQITELGRNSGNIHIWAGATMNMEGGKILDGMATGAGGNVTVYGTLNMSGGQIVGGKIKEGKSINALKEVVAENANIHCFNGTFNMTGGYIDGYVRIASSGKNDDGTPKTSKVSISGDSRITGGKKNVTLFGGVVIEMGKLGSKANITMTSGGFVTGETLASNVAYVHSDLDGLKAEYVDSKIFIGKMQCVCGSHDSKHYGDCDGTKLPWRPWSDETSLPRDNDNYFLMCDVRLEKEVSVATDSTLRINLNGYKINGANNSRVFQVTNPGSKLIVTDNSEKQNGRVVAKGTAAESFNGMCIWLGGKENYAAMYAGILDASGVVSQKGGPALFVAKNNTFDMFGGTVRGGSVVKDEKKAGGTCGTIYVIGTMNIWDGLVYGGKSEGNAGNIYVANGAICNLHGGKINGGKADGKGGNIHSHGTVNMYGGIVEKGESKGAGGNILIGETSSGTYGALNMYGGSIWNGKAGEQGGNLAFEGNFKMTGGLVCDGTSGRANSENVAIWQRQKTDSFEMSGGEIRGGVAFMTNKDAPTASIIKAVLSGTAIIKTSKKEAVSLLIPKNNQITIGDLKSGAEIWITGSGTVAKDAISTDAQYFKLDAASSCGGVLSGLSYYAKDSTLFIGKMQCICGGVDDKHYGECDGTELQWIPWNDATSLPRDNNNYFLTCDVTLEKEISVAKNSILRMDLNGYKIYGADDKRVFQVTNPGSELILTDNSEKRTGRIVAKGTETESLNGMCIWMNGKENRAAMYAGILDASGVVSQKGGPALFVAKNNTFNMFDGTIRGGLVVKNEENAGGTCGTAYVNGILNIWDGLVYGGKAEGNAGNIYVANGAILNLYGGRVNGGKADGKGGNIHSHGIVNMYDGAYVELGQSGGAGGNILIGETSSGLYGILNMYGGTVAKGKAVGHGGNLAFEGNFKMTGGWVGEGTSEKNENSGNVYIWQYHETDSFEMSGGKILGNVAFNTNANAPETSIIKAILSGTAYIKKSADSTVSLLIPSGNQIKLGELKEGAEVWITGSGTIAKDVVATDTQYIKLDEGTSYDGAISGATYCAEDNTLFIGRVKGPGTCLCGRSRVASGDKSACIGDCDGVWHAWTPTITLPTKSGYYYLIKDIVAADARVASDATVNLDLNGYEVTNKDGKRLISVSTSFDTRNAKLNLVDHVGTGTIRLVETPNGNGGIVWLQGAGNELSIYGGTYDASAVDCTYNGVAVCVSGSGASIFHMYDGTIVGGSTSGYGGAVYVNTNNKFEMTGGSIIGGKAQQGGNVYMAGSMELSKGAIIKGGMSNTEGDTPSGGNENIRIEQGSAETNGIKFADCTVEGVLMANLVKPIEVTSETVISKPEGGDFGLVVANYPSKWNCSWMTWVGAEYTADSKGSIYINTVSDNAFVMDKGVLLADRQLFRERVQIKSKDWKLFFSEVTLDTDGNPTGKGKVLMTSSASHVHCVCGGQADVCGDGTKAHNEVVYTKWEKIKILPWSDQTCEPGNYYLETDINLDTVSTLSADTYSLCLNNRQITGQTSKGTTSNGNRYGNRVFNVSNGTLNIVNCDVEKKATVKSYCGWQSADGKAVMASSEKMNFAGFGGIFYVNSGTVNCYNLHLDASDYLLANDDSWKGGSVAWVREGALNGYNCTYERGSKTNVNQQTTLGNNPQMTVFDAWPFMTGKTSNTYAELKQDDKAFKEKTSE